MDLPFALQTWREGFLAAMLCEACVFGPYNILAFRVLPLSLRPTVAAVLAFISTLVIAALTTRGVELGDFGP